MSRVNFGILSTAEITQKVAPAILACEKSCLYAVASRDLKKAQEWAAKNAPEAKAFGSYDELLADVNVHAVYVPLPTRIRNEWLIKAANAGKHVYAEKPMAEGFDAVLEACRVNNVQYMDGTMWYHSIRTRVVKQHLEQLGDVRRVTAAFTFAAPDEAWLQGGNGRTNKAQEPLGCFGDQGHYPLSAILFGNNFELPVKVQMLATTLNKLDTIVAASGFLWFKNGGVASFDCGATLAHRAFVEFATARGTVRIDDLVGGDSRTGKFEAYFAPFVGSTRTGKFEAYFAPFVGSTRFFESDVKGNEIAVPTEPCDHVIALVSDFCDIVQSKKLDDEWPRRSLAVFRTMQALFRSFQENNSIVEL
jgi:xylose dehydrogenase (NAD/NADP)